MVNSRIEEKVLGSKTATFSHKREPTYKENQALILEIYQRKLQKALKRERQPLSFSCNQTSQLLITPCKFEQVQVGKSKYFCSRCRRGSHNATELLRSSCNSKETK